MGRADPYNLDPSFEAGFVTALCSRPRLWGVVGRSIQAECLGLPAARLAMMAATMIASEGGETGPEQPSQVLQRLRRLFVEGKLKNSEIASVLTMFDDAEDAGLLSNDAYLSEIVPIVRRRMEKEGLETGLAEYAKKGDIDKAIKIIEKSKTLGAQQGGIGTTLGTASAMLLYNMSKLVRFNMGINELDDMLGGGLPRSTLTMFLAGTGGGKSMSLCLTAAAAMAQGMHVGLVTLELPEYIQHARLLSCLTAIPVDSITSDPFACGALEEFDRLSSNPGWGCLAIKDMPAKVTHMGHILSWIAECEDTWGTQMDVLVVDYADKLKAKGLSAKANENSYQSSGDVYEDLFLWAKDNRRWSVTASQVGRNKERTKKRKIVTDDVADSMNKVRTADVVIALNREEDNMMTFGIEKNRLGRGECSAGPLPCDFSVARVGPFSPMDVYRHAALRRR